MSEPREAVPEPEAQEPIALELLCGSYPWDVSSRAQLLEARRRARTWQLGRGGRA